MPRAPKPTTASTVLAPANTANALMAYQEQMSALIAQEKDQLAGIGGNLKSISFKAGMMRIGDAVVPNSEIAVVVLAFTVAKTYYGGKEYQDGDKAPPICYAFAPTVEKLAPHAQAKEKQCETCKDCPHNKFGTAERGKGKACSDRLRMVGLEAGTLKDGKFTPFTDPEAFRTGDLYTWAVSATNMPAWKNYRDLLNSGDLPRATLAAYTKIKVSPHPKHLVDVAFTDLGTVPPEVFPVLLARMKSASENLTAPYPEAANDVPTKAAKGAKSGGPKGAKY